MKKKNFILLSVSFLVFVFVFSMSGLGVAEQEYPYGPPPWILGFSQFDLANVWRVQVEAEIKYELVKHKDIQVYRTDAQGKTSKQISDIEDLLARGVDILLIAPSSTTALNPVIEKAYDQGVPVVTICSQVTSGKVAAACYTDNYEYGRTGATKIAEILNGKGEVIALRGYPGNSNDIGRYKGFKSVLEEYPGIKLVAEEYVYWDLAKAKRASEELLAAHPEIDAAWSCGGSIGRGFMFACLEAGMEVPLPINGGDSENGFLKMWKKYQPKGFDSIVAGFPPYVGQVGIQVVSKILHGEKYEKDNVVVPEPITAENLDQYVRPEMPDKMFCFTHLPDDILKSLYPAEE